MKRSTFFEIMVVFISDGFTRKMDIILVINGNASFNGPNYNR